MIELNYPGLLSSNNLRAALRVIREGESNQEDDGPESGYRAMYHPTERRFWTGPLEGPHPKHYEPLPDGSGRKSSAFGAYQHTGTTWDGLNSKYGLADDIGGYSQDCHAVALIYDVGALDDVIDGDFDAFLRKCGSQWASLPNSSLQDGGSKLTYDRALAVWKKYGGGVPVVISSKPRELPPEVEPPEPTAEELERIQAIPQPAEEPMAAPLLFIVPLLQSLFEAFSPLVRAKVTKALDKQGVDAASSGAVADNLMGIVKGIAGAATGAAGVEPRAAAAAATDPLVAVATVKANPALVAQAEEQMSDYIDKIAPMLTQIEKMEQGAWSASEDSMDRAAERAKGDPDPIGQPIMAISAALVALLVVFACGIAGWQVYKAGSPTTEVWAQIAGLIGFGTGVWVTIVSYRYGSSRQSQTKDFAIAELSQRKKA